VILLLPIYFFISVAILFFDGLPIFYIQKRTGKEGKGFNLYKFRTMLLKAEKSQVIYKKYNEANGPVFKIRNDPRFTQAGKFLSHTGLDELPQLFNVLKGDMALIGPRPLPAYEAAKLRPWQKKRETLKPGIISPWIINGYHNESFDAWMKSDIKYTSDKSVVYDLIIFIKAGRLFVNLITKELFKK
jgi:lipopolysaccharide/colanic/teichoic acid biosynthesis glycosyltransferase